jgi:hypothetical protein
MGGLDLTDRRLALLPSCWLVFFFFTSLDLAMSADVEYLANGDVMLRVAVADYRYLTGKQVLVCQIRVA